MLLHLNKLEFHSPTHNMCQVWLKLSNYNSTEKKFLDIVNVVLLFRYHPPLGKACGPSFEQRIT